MASPFDPEKAVYIAKMEEEAQLYHEMLETMKKVANTVAELNADERNMLSLAYKKNIRPLRAFWKTLSSNLEKESNEEKANLMREYLKKVEAEMTDICRDALLIIATRLLPSCRFNDRAAPVFYFKMKADFLRYITEITTGDEKELAREKSLRAYEVAMDLARMELTPVDPLRIAVALNFSVFYYEILGSTDRACKMANKAYSEAAANLDLDIYSFIGQVQKDSRDMMKSLMVNATKWEAKKLGPPLA